MSEKLGTKHYNICGTETSRYQWPLVDIAMGLHSMITGSADFEPVAAKRMALFIKARLKDWQETSLPHHANLMMAINKVEADIFRLCFSVLDEYAMYKKWRNK
jgi:hypothetical protein